MTHETTMSAIVTQMRKRPSLAVFGLALLLRLAWVVSLPNELTWVDERQFATIARHIANGDGYVSSSFRANPVLPFYLSLSFRIFGDYYLPARIGQSVLGALTCVLVSRVGSLLVSPAVGLLAGTILAFYLPHIYLAGVFYVDAWLIFLCSLSLFLAARTLTGKGRVPQAFAVGVTLGLTALTRGLFLVAVPSVCLAWLFAAHWSWARKLALCSVVVLGCGLAILPWSLRNYSIYGKPVLVSSGFYTYLWRGNNELATGGPDDRVISWTSPAWHERLTSVREPRRGELQRKYREVEERVRLRQGPLEDQNLVSDEVIKPVVLDLLVSDPRRVAILALKKIQTLYSAFSNTESENEYTGARSRLLAALSFYPVLAFALLGAFIGMRHWGQLLMIYLLTGGVTLSYALLVACTRFRLALDPYLILFASLAFVELYEWATGTSRAADVAGDYSLYPASQKGYLLTRGRTGPPGDEDAPHPQADDGTTPHRRWIKHVS